MTSQTCVDGEACIHHPENKKTALVLIGRVEMCTFKWQNTWCSAKNTYFIRRDTCMCWTNGMARSSDVMLIKQWHAIERDESNSTIYADEQCNNSDKYETITNTRSNISVQ